MTEIKSVLSEALRQENHEIAEGNVARVRAELGVIRYQKGVIASAEKAIAESVKKIKGYEAEAPLTAKSLLA